MFFFSFHVIPQPDSEHAKTYAGAQINCWIDFKSQLGAQKLAEIAIEDEGWIIQSLDREIALDRDSYDGSEHDFPYFEEAMNDGWSFVYYTYPHGPADQDEEPK